MLWTILLPVFVFVTQPMTVYAQDAESTESETKQEPCYDKHTEGANTAGAVGGFLGFVAEKAIPIVGDDIGDAIEGGFDSAGGAYDTMRNLTDNPLQWFICGVSDILSGTIDFLNVAVTRMMLFDPTKDEDAAKAAYTQDCLASSPNDPNCAAVAGINEAANAVTLKTLWRNVLNVVNIMLIIAMLIMIISTALNIGIFSNYTVKKTLPRIIVAALAANLSWVICSIVISSINYIGLGIQQVMIFPLTQNDGPIVSTLSEIARNNGYSAAEAGANLGIVFDLGVLLGLGGLALIIFSPVIVILLPVMAAILVAVIIAFLVFLLRRILLIMLVLLSPVAFMFWAFPGGENIFKKWWKSFTQLLLIYPYAMVLMGSGVIVSSVIGQTGGGNFTSGNGAASKTEDILTAFLMIFAMILPYLLLPMAFKAISGVLGTFTGMLNDKGKGLVDRAKNVRDNTSKYALNKQGRKERRDAQRKRGWQDGMQGDDPLSKLRKRRGYGGAGLNPFRREANRDFGAALFAERQSKHEKEERDIQRIKLDQAALAGGWTRDQIIANAAKVHETSNSKAERMAARDVLTDQKADKELTRAQDIDRRMGGSRAAEADEHTASRFGDIKGFAAGLTAELRDKDGKVRNHTELESERAKKLSDATHEVKATQSATHVSHVLSNSTAEQTQKITDDYGAIAANGNLNGKLASDLKPDPSTGRTAGIETGVAAGVSQRDLMNAVRLGVAGAPQGASNQSLDAAAKHLESSVEGLKVNLNRAAAGGQDTRQAQAQLNIEVAAQGHVNAEVERRRQLPPPPKTP